MTFIKQNFIPGISISISALIRLCLLTFSLLFIMGAFSSNQISTGNLNSKIFTEPVDKTYTAAIWAFEHMRYPIRDKTDDSIEVFVPGGVHIPSGRIRFLFSAHDSGSALVRIDPENQRAMRIFPGDFKIHVWNRISDGLRALK